MSTGLDIEALGPRVYRIVGELDMASAELLLETLDPVVAEGDGLRLELDALTFMDSKGLGALIHLGQMLAGRGVITLVRPQRGVLQLLELAGVLPLDLFEIEDPSYQ